MKQHSEINYIFKKTMISNSRKNNKVKSTNYKTKTAPSSTFTQSQSYNNLLFNSSNLLKKSKRNEPLQIIKESPRSPDIKNRILLNTKPPINKHQSSFISMLNANFKNNQSSEIKKERLHSGGLVLSLVKEKDEDLKIYTKKVKRKTSKVIHRNKKRQALSNNNYYNNSLINGLNLTSSTHNSSTEIFKKKKIILPLFFRKRDLSNDSIRNKTKFKREIKLITIMKPNTSNITDPNLTKTNILTKKEESKILQDLPTYSQQVISLFKRDSEYKSKKIPASKEIEQPLLVADENISIISPKSIPYTKQIYTNKYISTLFQLSQKSYKCSYTLLSFLSNNDLFHLSIVNKIFYTITLDKIRKIIMEKILQTKHVIHNNIWQKMKSYSVLSMSSNISKVYLTNVFKRSSYFEEIKKDLCRTIPNDIYFKKDASHYKMLFALLNAYSNFNPKIGYAQGLNFITAKLFQKFPNEIDSFIFIDAIFTKLKFESVLGVNNSIQKHMTIINHLLEEYIPSMYNYFISIGINHELFTANWLITLFSNCCDSDLLFIIWDFIFVYEWKFLYLFMISILKFNRNIILKMQNCDFPLFAKNIMRSKSFRENFTKIISNTFDLMSKKEWNTYGFSEEKSLEETSISQEDVVDIDTDDEIVYNSIEQ